MTETGDPDRLNDVGEPAHQHLVALATDDACAAQGRQFLPVAVVRIGVHDVVRPASEGRLTLVPMAGQDRDRTERKEPA